MREENRYEVARFMVAGVAYGDYAKMKLKVGDKLDLFGEPRNAHDSKAISIRKGSWKLGYVPREAQFQSILWNLHSQGIRMKAFVVAVNPTNPTWQMFCVKVCTNKDISLPQRGLIQF